MKLYGIYGSNNVRKVLSVAKHLGIELDIEWLSLYQMEHKTEEYLKLNPNGKVPTLVDEDFVLWETNAINRYLCAKVGGSELYPEDVRLRAQVDQWLSWELAHYNQALGTVAWEAVAKPQFLNMEGDKPVLDWATIKLEEFASVLDKHLENRKYMVSDHLTLADYAIVHIEIFRPMIPFDWSKYPNVSRYYDEISSIDNWKSTEMDMSKVK
ncbi:MAG: glutathione S-transferase family protein [Kangiellaceae bacterium]|nr:glutathione S-transferase family protein [Kangiellaceae bacterium]